CEQFGTTGDGIVAALQVLTALDHINLTLEEALSSLKNFPQVLINVPVAEPITDIDNRDVLLAVQAAEKQLADKGRVLLRPSGTEPLVRVMVEGEDAELVQQLAGSIADCVRAALC
ncbi:MAG: phosphoglucosamine mutase, partial [Pseudohongiellaceae bacterium]